MLLGYYKVGTRLMTLVGHSSTLPRLATAVVVQGHGFEASLHIILRWVKLQKYHHTDSYYCVFYDRGHEN